MQRSNVIDATALLRQARPAANDRITPRDDGLDAMGPEPRQGASTPGPGSAAGLILRAQAVAEDFWLMYSPLWARLVHWPNVIDALQRVALGLFLGGLVGVLATCTHGS